MQKQGDRKHLPHQKKFLANFDGPENPVPVLKKNNAHFINLLQLCDKLNQKSANRML
jgi:hypothetical protein